MLLEKTCALSQKRIYVTATRKIWGTFMTDFHTQRQSQDLTTSKGLTNGFDIAYSFTEVLTSVFVRKGLQPFTDQSSHL